MRTESTRDVATARTPRRRAWIASFVVVLLGSALYVWHVRETSLRLTPPDGAVDLHGFLERMPVPNRAYELSVKGARFVELVGPMPPASSLPSGPPAYVFDASRQLVDRIADQGDDPGFVARWHASGRRELTKEERAALPGRR